MRICLPRAILLCSLLAAGAAAQASPHDDLAEGQAAVINALVAGADAHATSLLDRARRNLQAARDSIVRNELDRARQFARKAFDDATAAEYRALMVREARLDKGTKAATP
jgi:ATP-dependent protease HslVU (ClpYQ) peptidase subunit